MTQYSSLLQEHIFLFKNKNYSLLKQRIERFFFSLKIIITHVHILIFLQNKRLKKKCQSETWNRNVSSGFWIINFMLLQVGPVLANWLAIRNQGIYIILKFLKHMLLSARRVLLLARMLPVVSTLELRVYHFCSNN